MDRFVAFKEYEQAIINLKKMIRGTRGGGAVTNHILLDGSVHPDTNGPTSSVERPWGVWGESGPIADGDIARVQGNGGGPKWTRLPKGNDGEILTLEFGLPEWRGNSCFGVVYSLILNANDAITIINATDLWAKFIVPVGATGDWLGHDNEIASYAGGGGWGFTAPQEWSLVYSYDEQKLKMFNTAVLGGWGPVPGG